MLKYRLITGPLLIALILALVWVDDRLDQVALTGAWKSLFLQKELPPRGVLLFSFAFLVIAPLAGWELASITRAQGIATRTWLTILAAMCGLIVSYSIPMNSEVVTAIAIMSTGMIVVFVGSLLTFSQSRNVQGVIAAAGAVMFSMVYLGLMLGFLLAIRRTHSAWFIVGIILTTKACDTGAYFTGRAIGRHKLIPWLSPGKTWEGLLGGVLAAVLLGTGLALLSHRLPMPSDHINPWLGALCGFIFALVGQFGDLTKSLLKRGAGIKDSSSILPGLGGVLDVIDSPLMVAPVAFWLLEFAGS